MTTIVIPVYSDIHCPWATVALHRLRQARDRLGLDAVFDPRAWPLEWVNERGTPRHVVEPEAHVLAAHEPELFSAWRGDTWPSTFLPALELVAAARRAAGVRAAEDVDRALRLRFFRESADVSLRHELRAALGDAATWTDVAGLRRAAVLDRWERDNVRADVVDDYASSDAVPVEGSPQVVWPDGSTTHNPGMRDVGWVRGIPRIGRSDPHECERLLLEKVA